VSMKRNMLNQAQTFELTTWLRSNWNQIKLEHMTYGKAAQSATEALGFRVSLGNVQGVHEQVNQKLLGDWPTSRPFDRSQEKPGDDAARAREQSQVLKSVRSLLGHLQHQVEGGWRAQNSMSERLTTIEQALLSADDRARNVERLLEQLVEMATSNGQPQRKGELFGSGATAGNNNGH
jgi:hypothetical protein